jgi:hypothetical protein
MESHRLFYYDDIVTDNAASQSMMLLYTAHNNSQITAHNCLMKLAKLQFSADLLWC